ncbi:cysteine desulfurase family protein [Robertkochia solimangrovi]|uniref:cysteine desulfurase family protein n=1 Tax=Robertkochia solimangrovi TaxID=2213046 RepID=UPI00117F8325|nr:cysteine desulfurase family protein [Robertkochia solimangrovi]TRZ43763.1 cysteine desulfurase [Robertkochia solimangrovi]
MQNIYLDNAATTRIRPEVLERMVKGMEECYGNPSSTHSFGRAAKAQIEKARKTIARQFKVSPAEIIFTSGGTEADNMILVAAVRDLGVKHIISAKTEHHAVLHTLEALSKQFGTRISYVALNSLGSADPDSLKEILSDSEGPALVSLMHINNETGNRIDLEAFSKICKEHNAYFHSDTVQSVGHWELDLSTTPVDFITAAAHKFHGPKGVGFAFIRKGIGINPLILGGEQERGMRAGTESYHNIIGLEEALIQAYANLEEEQAYISGLKSYFIEALTNAIPGTIINGGGADPELSTYNVVNVRLPFSEDKASLLLFQLDLKGIACSRGSACQSGSSLGSHVLQEMLDETEMKKPSVRFSFSRYNTKEELDTVVEVLKEYGES